MIDQLIDDLILIIFKKVKFSDLLNLKQVNNRFNQLIIKNYQAEKLIYYEENDVIKFKSGRFMVNLFFDGRELSNLARMIKKYNSRRYNRISYSMQTEDKNNFSYSRYQYNIIKIKDNIFEYRFECETIVDNTYFKINTNGIELEIFKLLYYIYSFRIIHESYESEDDSD